MAEKKDPDPNHAGIFYPAPNNMTTEDALAMYQTENPGERVESYADKADFESKGMGDAPLTYPAVKVYHDYPED